jgi:hypothetical protein
VDEGRPMLARLEPEYEYELDVDGHNYFAAWSARARIANGNENKGTLEDFCSKSLKFSLQMPM